MEKFPSAYFLQKKDSLSKGILAEDMAVPSIIKYSGVGLSK